jgi:RNA polymerase sigma-70 factor (ECF subfamily)
LRLLGSPEDAQDVLQDSFVRAFEKLDQFHGESSFYTWIYRIAVNLALSEYRRHRQRGRDRWADPVSLNVAAEPVDVSSETDPAIALERVERELIVQTALNELGPEHRAVVVLKDFDGRRYEEIASLLEIPIGTVRSRLHRARSELRERLRSLVDADVAGASSPRDVQKVADP